MTPSSLKPHYQRFLKGHEGWIHLAAHSHHFWPDVSREAHLRYWDDCSVLSDRKWEKIFSDVIPESQKIIAEILNLKDSEQIIFAPNTHELATRVLSTFLGRKSLRVLTTTGEFHSWSRQLRRLEELPGVEVIRIEADLLRTDRDQFLSQLKTILEEGVDLFYISQVFFDSGSALSIPELTKLQGSAGPECLVLIDGYHGFCALPTDLEGLEGKVFYLAGGYKYAQAGEGACFMVIPKKPMRPAYTGWFAQMGSLAQKGSELVGYPAGADAFWGSTQDLSGLYRFNAVWAHLKALGWGVEKIHQKIQGLQAKFIADFPQEILKSWKLEPLFENTLQNQGHFLTFRLPDADKAKEFHDFLKSRKILVDYRGDRVRFGFGTYLDEEDVLSALDLIRK